MLLQVYTAVLANVMRPQSLVNGVALAMFGPLNVY